MQGAPPRFWWRQHLSAFTDDAYHLLIRLSVAIITYLKWQKINVRYSDCLLV